MGRFAVYEKPRMTLRKMTNKGQSLIYLSDLDCKNDYNLYRIIVEALQPSLSV